MLYEKETKCLGGGGGGGGGGEVLTQLNAWGGGGEVLTQVVVVVD